MKTIKIGGTNMPVYGEASVSRQAINDFTHFCGLTQEQQAYNTCAVLADSYLDQAVTKEDVHACFEAMRRDRCNALRKRKLEREHNVSLYFTPKQTPEAVAVVKTQKKNAAYWRGWNLVGESLKRGS